MKTVKKLLKKDMKEKREFVNIYIDRHLPKKDEYPKVIHKAMRYSLFSGGKGVRSYLAISTYNLFSDDIKPIIPLAAAIEMIHTYTLIHDDLPYIDNDDFRRGKKSCHKMFGQDIAILAGDALLTYAMEIVGTMELDTRLASRVAKILTDAIGANGLVGGQFLDVESANKFVSTSTLKYIHQNKTGKLFYAPVEIALLMASAPKDKAQIMRKYAQTIGLAFQIADDVLDIEGNFKTLGKSVGKDLEQKKATYPAVFGLDVSKQEMRRLVERAKKMLECFEEKGDMLMRFTEYIYTRQF